MHNIKVNSTFGNFKFSGEADVTDEQLQILAQAGLLQLLQRSPATAAEKKLAGYDKKRPEGFKRTDIPFSVENAGVLAGFLGEVEVEGDGSVDADGKEVAGAKSKLSVLVDVSEHVPNAGAEPAYRDQKQLINLYLVDEKGAARNLADGTPRSVETFADKRGITPPEDPANWSEDKAFLGRVKAWEQAQKASQD